MAIIFNKTIPNDKLCLAYNNNILDFTTNNVLDVINCQVTINGTSIVLYPHPNKRFYLNLKQYITTFLNVDNFTDDLLISDITITPTYDWTDKVFLDTDIDIQINFVDLSNETATISSKWLSGYLQLNTREDLQSDDVIVLLPQNLSTRTMLLKYWEEYPLDLSIYNGKYLLGFIEMLTSQGNYAFGDNFLGTRFIFSDGLNKPILNIINSFNLVFENIQLKNNDITRATIKLQTITPKCDNGFYIKWINSLGGYSYWLFENWESNQQTKDLGEINNDYNNLEDTLSETIQIGKTSQNRVNVTTDVINEDEQLLLSDLFDSPKIYWFIGTPNAVNNFNDWTEISLVTSSIPKEKTKRSLNNFTLTFELPINDTRTI
jgi:hypothetical protein